MAGGSRAGAERAAWPAVPTPDLPAFALACPGCRGPLDVEADAATCASCGARFGRVGGIWDFLPAERSAAFAGFLGDYQRVRAAEGWGSGEADYYRRLPSVGTADPQRAIWRLRAASYVLLRDRVLAPLEARPRRRLRVLDLGAGNCWLAHRLAERGHLVAAVDLSTSPADGLGAYPRYGSGAVCLARAEFDRLPFAAGQADLAIFNAALHYAADPAATIGEALRVLRSDGHLVVLDSPVYHDARSGARMVRERAARFRRALGIGPAAAGSVGFLTWAALARVADDRDLRWRAVSPVPGWRRGIRGVKAWLRGQREPAQFPLLIGTRRAAEPNDAGPGVPRQ